MTEPMSIALEEVLVALIDESPNKEITLSAEILRQSRVGKVIGINYNAEAEMLIFTLHDQGEIDLEAHE